MESTSERNESFRFQDVKPFPNNSDGKINLVEFLEATSNLIKLVDHLGKVFAPVKYDMEGNVEKIKKIYTYDNCSCLLELMSEEHSRGQTCAIEGVLWLNRALLFFELVFQEIVLCLDKNECEYSMKKIYTLAYEGSVKKYHNWITQQLFTFICKMSPTLPQIIKSLGMENDHDTFKSTLSRYNTTLHAVRCQIDNFFVSHSLFLNL